jgi:acyl-CoA thioester hydrolase
MTPMPASAPDGEPRATRADYRRWLTIPTRWHDNDAYGHVNNVVYYAYFDTVVNEHLIRAGGLDIAAGPEIGLVVETSCRYFRSLAFPDTLEAGLRVDKLGHSSVVYGIGIFRAGDAEAAATGRFVHVWVDRATQRPVRVPQRIRDALAGMLA